MYAMLLSKLTKEHKEREMFHFTIYIFSYILVYETYKLKDINGHSNDLYNKVISDL